MVDIAATLIHWYAENKRELPWRETTDPYRIWISEIILQQTLLLSEISDKLIYPNPSIILKI